MKASNFSDCSGNGPIKSCFDLMKVHFNSLYRDNISQENNRIIHKGALLDINIETLPVKELADCIQMMKMFFFRPAVD